MQESDNNGNIEQALVPEESASVQEYADVVQTYVETNLLSALSQAQEERANTDPSANPSLLDSSSWVQLRRRLMPSFPTIPLTYQAPVEPYTLGMDVSEPVGCIDVVESMADETAEDVADVPEVVNLPPVTRGTYSDEPTGMAATYISAPPRIPVGVDAVPMDIVYRFFELMGEALRPFMVQAVSVVSLPNKWSLGHAGKYATTCTAVFNMDDCRLSVNVGSVGAVRNTPLFLTGYGAGHASEYNVHSNAAYMPNTAAEAVHIFCTIAVHVNRGRVGTEGRGLAIAASSRDRLSIVRNPRGSGTRGSEVSYYNTPGTTDSVRKLCDAFAWRVPNVGMYVHTACLVSMRRTTSRLIVQAKAGKVSPIPKSSTLPTLVPPVLSDTVVHIVADILFTDALDRANTRVIVADNLLGKLQLDLAVLFADGHFSQADRSAQTSDTVNILRGTFTYVLSLKPAFGVACLPTISLARRQKAVLKQQEKVFAALTTAGKGADLGMLRELHRILRGTGGIQA